MIYLLCICFLMETLMMLERGSLLALRRQVEIKSASFRPQEVIPHPTNSSKVVYCFENCKLHHHFKFSIFILRFIKSSPNSRKYETTLTRISILQPAHFSRMFTSLMNYTHIKVTLTSKFSPRS